MAKKAARSAGKSGGDFVVEMWPVDRAKPYAENPRKITDAAVAKVAAVIKEFGWRQPIVVDKDGVIVVGHTRRLAAISLGLDKVPVHVASNLTEAQIRAYRIADNRVGEETDWDRDKLVVELSALTDLDIDLSSLGFDDVDIGELLGEAYKPILNPQSGRDDVTDADVAKAGDKLHGTIKDNAKKDIVDVICPHCGEEYGLARDALVG